MCVCLPLCLQLPHLGAGKRPNEVYSLIRPSAGGGVFAILGNPTHLSLSDGAATRRGEAAEIITETKPAEQGITKYLIKDAVTYTMECDLLQIIKICQGRGLIN